MSIGIHPEELSFFSVLAASPSLSVAARELGISTPAVSRRLAQMEARLGVLLVNRTTRRMSLTPEGDALLERARRILLEIDELNQMLSASVATPKGLLRVNATLGFGRNQIAPVISRFVERYPEVEVQLQLSVNPPPPSEDQYDVCIRFGEPPEARLIAVLLADDCRLLCASPKYLARHGVPKVPHDLAHHNCIFIRQGEEAYGVWKLISGRGAGKQVEVVRVHGNLSTNDGEIAVNWALDGHGILMRAGWNIRRYLESGRLVQVLPQYQTPEANIFAVYPEHHRLSVRVRAFVTFLTEALN